MKEKKRESFGSVSLVRQGNHSFYSLTLPSEVLAKTCFVITRDEDPIVGFQRELDNNRAKEIANYIDSGLGTIPSAIILSAQDTAELEYNSKTKSIAFNLTDKSFLIIDGQHRVYGFMLAKTAFRVPVVIYDGLSKRDETRLFIDINSKQKGVRPELLLDIKKLAEYESEQEEFLRDIFDLFRTEMDSSLLNKLSPSKKEKSKLSRPQFYGALKPLAKYFAGKDAVEVYHILNAYFTAFREIVLRRHTLDKLLLDAIVFKAICGFFPFSAAKLQDRFGAIYTPDNFATILEMVGSRIKPSKLEKHGNAYKVLIAHFEETMKSVFTL